MILSYGIWISYSIWSQTNQSIINQVESLYNRALKMLDRKQIRYHQILSKYKILSFAHFVFFHYVKFVFKMFKWSYVMFLRDCSGAVDPLERLLVEAVVIHCKTSFVQTVLSVKGVQFGNLLPDYLK